MKKGIILLITTLGLIMATGCSSTNVQNDITSEQEELTVETTSDKESTYKEPENMYELIDNILSLYTGFEDLAKIDSSLTTNVVDTVKDRLAIDLGELNEIEQEANNELHRLYNNMNRVLELQELGTNEIIPSQLEIINKNIVKLEEIQARLKN